ncbi:MAG: transcription factor S [Candidatus Thorarchaeota archaeon]
MQFCDDCGSMMMPFVDEDGNNQLKCRSCGHVKKGKTNLTVSQTVKRTARDKIVVVDDESIPMPKTAAACPKCGNNEAYYWTVQTRRGDEGATEFYRCTECKTTWRNYGG